MSLFQSPEKTAKSALPLQQAVVLSLVLHALALASLTDLPAMQSGGVAPPQPLRVGLRLLTEAGDTQGDADSPALRPQLARPERTAAPLPSPERAVSPAPTSGTAPTLPKDVMDADAGRIPGGMPLRTVDAVPITVAVAAPEEARGVDAAGLRQFRLALASEARRVRSYPEAARRAGITGTVEIRVSVNALSQRHVELAHSSGHAVLDEAAVGMLRLAAERCPLPDVLRGQEFSVPLPVIFEVEE
ncbi:MAG: TonB family protein [Rhodocyclaceae bacterium]